MRGKVGCFKFDDPYISENERKQTLETARSYFDLAESYSRPRPVLFITVGLVGSGKSTLSQYWPEAGTDGNIFGYRPQKTGHCTGHRTPF